MSAKSKMLCGTYGLIALAALVGTWSNNLTFFAMPDSGGLAFIRACFVNPAAASITIDVLFVCATAFVFMGVEARRLGIRFVWLYMVLSLVIAVSVMFPLFLLARELRLAKRESTGATGA